MIVEYLADGAPGFFLVRPPAPGRIIIDPVGRVGDHQVGSGFSPALTPGNAALIFAVRIFPAEQGLVGWGGRDRTFECWNQNPVPYHLATPQQVRGYPRRGPV